MIQIALWLNSILLQTTNFHQKTRQNWWWYSNTMLKREFAIQRVVCSSSHVYPITCCSNERMHCATELEMKTSIWTLYLLSPATAHSIRLPCNPCYWFTLYLLRLLKTLKNWNCKTEHGHWKRANVCLRPRRTQIHLCETRMLEFYRTQLPSEHFNPFMNRN